MAIAALLPGPNTLTIVTVQGVDSAGQRTTVTRLVRANITPPRLQATAPSVTNLPEATISGSAKPADPQDGVAVTVNGQPAPVAADGSFSLSALLSPGPNTFQVVATDGYGNSAAITLSVVLDQTPPVIQIGGVTDGQFSSAPFLIPTFTVTDDHPGTTTTTTLDGAAFTSRTPLSAEGTHHLVVTATDAAGNQAIVQVTSTLDRTPPVLILPADLEVDAASSAGAVVSFTAKASDAVNGPLPVTCSPTSASRFPIGVTRVACGATDRATNTSRGSFNSSVNGPIAQLTNLFPKIETLAASLNVPANVVKAWERRLQAVVSAGPTPANCRTLHLIAAALRLQPGPFVTAAQAAQLNQILAALVNIGAATGC